MDKIIYDIVKARKDQDLSETALAKMIGEDQNKVWRLLNGKTKKLDLEVVAKLRAALGIDLFPITAPVFADDSIVSEKTERFVASSRHIKVPVYKALGDCGPGAINHHDRVESWLSFTAEYARATFGTAGTGLCCIRATGDSMQPTIFPGDLVVLNTTENSLTRDGSVYVLQMGETTLIKRLQRLSASMVRVVSDNSTGWSKDMSTDEIEAEGLKIVGRVVFIGKLL